MKRDRTGNPTERALVRMLMENTGRHFLDSGGAYGRDWERNQSTGMWRAADWLATPEITTEAWRGVVDEASGLEVSDDGYPTLSVFHYLRQRLEYDSQLTAWLIREGDRTNDPWLESMEQWAEARHEKGSDYWDLASFNSYNDENLLSQTIQGTRFTYRDAPYVALQIHGGADVRGGYTKPKVFRVMTDEAWSFFDWQDWSFGHEWGPFPDAQEPLPDMPSLPESERHYWDIRGGEATDYDGMYVKWDEYADRGHLTATDNLAWVRPAEGGMWAPRCPLCGQRTEVYAPPAW